MDSLTVSLKHVASGREQPCGVCGANFVPAEDSGSRVLSIRPAGEAVLGALMCGGCHSKWTHGQVITLRPQRAS
ncbi:MAG TPA: hypothetical protein VH458_02600 [Vicinamibacterales bacterium]|jgi:hypothetical protein